MEFAWEQPTMKAALLLVSALCVHLSLSPPNPPVKKEELYSRKINTSTIFENVIQYITFCSKTMMWLAVTVELAVSAPHYYACPSMIAGWCPTPFDPPAWTYECSPILVLGTLFTITAAFIRLWCFRTLGTLFTFEISIRPKHKLVTVGPYAWVRHPSYAGVYIVLTGASLVLAAPGTWLSTHGLWTLPGALLGLIWCVKCMFAFRGTSLRLNGEDKMLKETFGVEWQEYAARTPWKLVPWVF